MFTGLNVANVSNPRNRSLPAHFPTGGNASFAGNLMGNQNAFSNSTLGGEAEKLAPVTNRQALGIVPIFKKHPGIGEASTAPSNSNYPNISMLNNGLGSSGGMGSYGGRHKF
jgi:hypothetical protein